MHIFSTMFVGVAGFGVSRPHSHPISAPSITRIGLSVNGCNGSGGLRLGGDSNGSPMRNKIDNNRILAVSLCHVSKTISHPGEPTQRIGPTLHRIGLADTPRQIIRNAGASLGWLADMGE